MRVFCGVAVRAFNRKDRKGRPNGRKEENLELRGIRLPATFLPGFSQLTKFALFLRALPPSEEVAEKCRSDKDDAASCVPHCTEYATHACGWAALD
jgi:hypothetical protein